MILNNCTKKELIGRAIEWKKAFNKHYDYWQKELSVNAELTQEVKDLKKELEAQKQWQKRLARVIDVLLPRHENVKEMTFKWEDKS